MENFSRSRISGCAFCFEAFEKSPTHPSPPFLLLLSLSLGCHHSLPARSRANESIFENRPRSIAINFSPRSFVVLRPRLTRNSRRGRKKLGQPIRNGEEKKGVLVVVIVVVVVGRGGGGEERRGEEGTGEGKREDGWTAKGETEGEGKRRMVRVVERGLTETVGSGTRGWAGGARGGVAEERGRGRG